VLKKKRKRKITVSQRNWSTKMERSMKRKKRIKKLTKNNATQRKKSMMRILMILPLQTI
jgi:hypothetical protein